jgi:hypothetical protein
MFCLEFLNNLQQPPRYNPWPTHPTNQNYKMRFFRQCDYLFEFQVERRISKSHLLWNWPKNTSDTKKKEYETLVLAYSKVLDSLISVSDITRSSEEKESSLPHTKDVVTNSKEETKNVLPPSKDMPLRTQKTWSWCLHHSSQWVPTNSMTHQWNLT